MKNQWKSIIQFTFYDKKGQLLDFTSSTILISRNALNKIIVIRKVQVWSLPVTTVRVSSLQSWVASTLLRSHYKWSIYCNWGPVKKNSLTMSARLHALKPVIATKNEKNFDLGNHLIGNQKAHLFLLWLFLLHEYFS